MKWGCFVEMLLCRWLTRMLRLYSFPPRRAPGGSDYGDVTEHLGRLASRPDAATAPGTKRYDGFGVGTLNRAVAKMDFKADVPDYTEIPDVDAAPPRPRKETVFTRPGGAADTVDYNVVATGTAQLYVPSLFCGADTPGAHVSTASNK